MTREATESEMAPVEVDVIRHPVGADGTMRYRMTFYISVDSSYRGSDLRERFDAAVVKAFENERARLAGEIGSLRVPFGTSQASGFPLPPVNLSDADECADDHVPLSDDELDSIDMAASVGDYGTRDEDKDLIWRVVEEVRRLRTDIKLASNKTLGMVGELAALRDRWSSTLASVVRSGKWFRRQSWSKLAAVRAMRVLEGAVQVLAMPYLGAPVRIVDQRDEDGRPTPYAFLVDDVTADDWELVPDDIVVAMLK